MYTYFLFIIFDIIDAAWDFSDYFFFLSLSFCLRWSCLWHLNVNPLQPRTLFISMLLCLLILHLLMFDSMMMMPVRHFRRTSLDKAFIRNAKSFCRTLPTLTFPLSFTVGDVSSDVLVTCPLVLIQEFYSNMHEIDRSVPLFFTHVRGTRIPITP